MALEELVACNTSSIGLVIRGVDTYYDIVSFTYPVTDNPTFWGVFKEYEEEACNWIAAFVNRDDAIFYLAMVEEHS